MTLKKIQKRRVIEAAVAMDRVVKVEKLWVTISIASEYPKVSGGNAVPFATATAKE